MPLITVQYSSQRNVTKSDIAAAVTKLSADILHKDPNVTAIIVQSVDPADWFAGGRSLAEQKLASVWVDIHISDGTNTKDEKGISSPQPSSGWMNCLDHCTTKAISTSMMHGRMLTGSAD